MSTADEDGPPALCNECSAKWHAYVRSRTPQSSSTTRPSVVVAAAMPEEGDSLVVQGQGSILVALHNATDSEPATQGASNREIDLDEMEFGSRMDQLRAALARVKAEPSLDPLRSEALLAEKRRALRHREEVDTMVANASARRAREMQEGASSNHRTPPQRHVNPNSLVSSPPPVPTSSTGRHRQADGEGLPVHSVEEAMEIFTATEQFIDAQRRELMRETEAAWGAIRLREAQLAERERKLHAVMKEHHAHLHVRPAAPSAPLQRHPREEDNDEEHLQQFDDL